MRENTDLGFFFWEAREAVGGLSKEVMEDVNERDPLCCATLISEKKGGRDGLMKVQEVRFGSLIVSFFICMHICIQTRSGPSRLRRTRRRLPRLTRRYCVCFFFVSVLLLCPPFPRFSFGLCGIGVAGIGVRFGAVVYIIGAEEEM